ncbi:MAG: AMP-binding protein [Pyrinomonadaceae bacterium]
MAVNEPVLQSLPDGAPVPATLVELLRARAAAQPGRRVFTFLDDDENESAQLTFAELDTGARAVASMLQQAGAAGERALLLYPFGLEVVNAFFGCLYEGVVAVPSPPLNPARPQRTLSRLRSMVEDAGVTLGLTTSQMLPLIEGACRETEGLRGVRWLVTDALEQGSAEAWEMREIAGRTLAYLQYTSGSTTAPKGAMVSHANVLHNSGYIARAWRYTSESVSVVWVPYYHDDGLVHGIIQPIYRGGEAFLMSPQAFTQQPARWLRAVTSKRATHTGGPNFAFDLCVNKVTPEQCEGLDLSSWRMAYNAAEPVRALTLERFTARFAPHGFDPAAFHPSYGLAEATLLVTTKRDALARPAVCTVRADALERDRRVDEAETGEARARTFVSCGAPVGETRVVIADPDFLTTCAVDEVGEILVADAGVVRGYWRREDEERERTFGARLADTGEGPFLRTGDLGFIRDGELYITGRIKDLVIIRGQNYYPQDIEWTVERSHPSLRPGCCAALALDIGGEERLIIVAEARAHCTPVRYGAGGMPGLTCAADLPFDAEEVILAVRQAVAESHDLQPYALLLLEPGSIHKTSSGKIQRHACGEAFLAGTFDVVAAWVQHLDEGLRDSTDALADGIDGPPTVEAVQLWLVEHLTRRLGLDMPKLSVSKPDFDLPFNRLGLDSINAFELKNMIETRWGVELPIIKLLQDTTVAQLAVWVCAQAGTAAPLRAAAGQPSPSVAARFRPHEPDDLLADLERLSEAELDQVLSRLLAEVEGES